MGPIGCPETSITNYEAALCKIPEEELSQRKVGQDCNVNLSRGPKNK
jgi:hypothetical protein